MIDILNRLWQNLLLLGSFSQKSPIAIFTKICPVGAYLIHEDRVTDGRKNMTKLKIAFCYNANAPKTTMLLPFLYDFLLRRFILRIPRSTLLSLCLKNTERWKNNSERGKQKYSEKNLSRCHFVHHNSQMNWAGLEPRPPQWDACH